MNVTHVIRGENGSCPYKHLALYHVWFSEPVYAHLPLILNKDRSKLSKRQGDVAVEDFLAKGYLPEALVNHAALLGFNPTGRMRKSFHRRS
jgi:glutamyl/glutaminyl-tRNA synthetase